MALPKTKVSEADEAAATAHAASPEIDEITYIPEDGDPVRTTWNGLEFKAYVPTKVSKKHTVLSLIRQEMTNGEGNMISRAVEKRIPMVELAKGNCKFSVNGEAPFKKKEDKSRTPNSPDEYRGYAIGWIAGSTSASAMDTRWDGEAGLREKCGVNDGDIAYLRPFFEARHDEAAAAEAA